MNGPIDTSNRHCVIADGELIHIKVLPVRPLTRGEALNLAAWLVALADRRPGCDDSEFTAILKTILGS